jgi:hypothetical protein
MNASSGIYNINAYNIRCNATTILSNLNVKGVDVSDYFNNNNTNLTNLTTNLNNLSSTTYLSISGVSNNLNNLSANSILNINNLIATSATLLGYINALTNPTTLNVNNLNVSQKSVLNGAITCISSLNVSGFTTLNNNTNIKGIVNIYSGNQFAIPNNNMKSGSLTIGDIYENYGNGNNWNTNTSGLLLECLDNTEIAVHDSGHRLASLFSYKGGTTNTIFINRDMGYGNSVLQIAGNTKIGYNDFALTDSVFELFNNITVRKNVTANGVNYGDYVDIYSGTGLNISYISLRDGGDITLTSLKGSVNVMGGGLNVNGPITGSNIIKKNIFNFTCSTPISLNGTTYYRYDINLNLYTNKYTRTSGQTTLGITRKFKWMSWLATGVHEIGYDLNYDISCSYKATTPNIGLSICAYGWPESKFLSTVNSNAFLLRNSIDYITFCCSIQNTIITAMIIDYL